MFPGLGLIQTLICDGHDLLEDVTCVLLRLTEVVMLPRDVRVAHILVRQSRWSSETQHHASLVLHEPNVPLIKKAEVGYKKGSSFSNYQHLKQETLKSF